MSSYSRDDVVRELSSFYEFLVSLHIPKDALKYPPKEGWTQLTDEYLSFLEKDEACIDLLRHIPYIRYDDKMDPGPFQIYEKCVAVDYTGSRFKKGGVDFQDKDAADPLSGETELESHKVTLARPFESDGYYIFCDTRTGTLEVADFIDEEHRENSPKEFFDMLKEEYRRLDVFPINVEEVLMAKRNDEDEVEKYRDAYRKNGWPGKDFKREKCMKAVEKVREELG